MCSVVLIGDLLDVLEVEAGFEVIQNWAAVGRVGWLDRHGTSIRWARLIARMFGHGHRAVCSGGCQFEVLEERVLADSWSIIRANQIQPILSQIIDSCFYFPERFRDFSC